MPNIVKTMSFGTQATAVVGYKKLSNLAGNITEDMKKKIMNHDKKEKPTSELFWLYHVKFFQCMRS